MISFCQIVFFLLFFPPTPYPSLQQLEAAAARAAEEEKKRLQTQVELQDRFSLELEREKMVSSAWGVLLLLHIGSPVFSKGFPHRQPPKGFHRLCRRLENATCVAFVWDVGIKYFYWWIQILEQLGYNLYSIQRLNMIGKLGENWLKDKCRLKFSLQFSEMENLRPVLAVWISKMKQAQSKCILCLPRTVAFLCCVFFYNYTHTQI